MRGLIQITSLLVLAICISGTPVPARAGVPQAACANSNVYRIPMSSYHRAGSPQFQYAFEWIPAPKPILSQIYSPTIIHLPGGPGFGVNIGTGRLPGVPEYFNIIHTEQRGVGCNAPPSGVEYPYDFYSLDLMAKDVVELIRALRITNYYIYGRSFGTIHGTVVTNMIERAGLPKPKGLILESILGHGFSHTDWFRSVVYNWERVKPLIDPRVLTALKTEAMPFGYTLAQWQTNILGNLMFGDLPVNGNLVPLLMNGLVSTDPAYNKFSREAIAYSMAHPNTSTWPTVTLAIHCKDLWGSIRPQLFDGETYYLGQGDICAQLGLAPDAAPWDSAKWPVTVPIYYFAGPFDPTTPDSQARYHYAHQTSAQRHLAVIAGGGHGTLSFNLPMLKCSESVWGTIAFAPSLLGHALASCQWPIEFKTSMQGQP